VELFSWLLRQSGKKDIFFTGKGYSWHEYVKSGSIKKLMGLVANIMVLRLLVPGGKCHGHDEQAQRDGVVLEVTMIDQYKARVQG
jgi:hypothetical protein